VANSFENPFGSDLNDNLYLFRPNAIRKNAYFIDHPELGH